MAPDPVRRRTYEDIVLAHPGADVRDLALELTEFVPPELVPDLEPALGRIFPGRVTTRDR